MTLRDLVDDRSFEQMIADQKSPSPFQPVYPGQSSATQKRIAYTENYYTRNAALAEIDDLVYVDGYKRENITLEHVRATDTEDGYWKVTAYEEMPVDSTINLQDSRSYNKQQITYSDDFRRIQEIVRKGSQGASVLRRDIGEDARRRLARVTKLELDSNTSSQRHSQWTGVSNKGVRYNIIGEIPAQLFHDIFEVVRYYTENGELVDLHEDYSNCKCYLSDDGTCGFAIEPDGNLVSVFNLGLDRGFLSAIKDLAVAEGATHLDAFDSSAQPLRKIYEHALGAKVASSMDYNMEYDHDNIATNHGNPNVVFMVMGKATEGEVSEKHFNKDQYDEARAYQQSFLVSVNAPQQVTASSTISITPIEGDTKAKAKASISNKFLGYAEGIGESATAKYAEQAGDKANTGSYAAGDIVFVSMENSKGTDENRHHQQDKILTCLA